MKIKQFEHRQTDDLSFKESVILLSWCDVDMHVCLRANIPA